EERLPLAQGLAALGEVRESFGAGYRRMLDAAGSRSCDVTVCTIYDAIPGLGPAERAGLALFNEAILREAFRAGVSVIDLRLVCDEPGDYAAASPIEPSVAGGAKIAAAIARAMTGERAASRVII